jgi:hypothetical protein
MKRLFEVNGVFFSNKKDAKEARGERLNKDESGAVPLYKHEIHQGPDHWKAN